MKKVKRILAMIGVVFLVSLYLITLICGITSTPATAGFFKASIYCTVLVPIMLYVYMLIYKLLKKDKKEEDPNRMKK